MKINIIVACCSNNGIGFKNTIPWFIKNDMKYFSKITKGNKNNAIIMGRKTWDSLPRKPLPHRQNIILTRSVTTHKQIQDEYSNNTCCYQSPEQAVEFCETELFDEVWVIGGTAIYEHFYNEYNDKINKIYITLVYKEYNCDVFFPIISNHFKLVSSDKKEEIDENTKQKIMVEYNILERTDK